MNRLTTLLLSVIAAIIAAYIVVSHDSGPADKRAESTYERVLRTSEIRCAYAQNPPIFEKDPNTGKLSGIFYDIMTEVGKRLNVKINWVEEVTYGVIAQGFQTDRYDAFCATVWPTPERSRAASFTIPVYYSPVGIFVRTGDHRFDNDYSKLDDPAIHLSVRDGDISDVFSRDAFPHATLVSVPELSNELQSFDDVVHNKAEATISEPALLYHYLEANPGTLVNIAAEHPLRVSPNTIMLKPNEFQFKTMLDVTLSDLINSGFVDKTLHKYDKYSVFMPIAHPYQLVKTK